MKQAMSVAVVICVLFAALGGIGGAVLCYALAVPIGIALWLIGHAAGWFDK